VTTRSSGRAARADIWGFCFDPVALRRGVKYQAQFCAPLLLVSIPWCLGRPVAWAPWQFFSGDAGSGQFLYERWFGSAFGSSATTEPFLAIGEAF
jgi:hypothetical protein